LKVKEAYDVLSDPKKKQIYDEVGLSGLKFLDNPADVNPSDLIKNFQVKIVLLSEKRKF
jgi:DnaJ-class molecular chaperone